MKSIFIVFLLAFCFKAQASISFAPDLTVQADSTVWKDYIGKYKGIEGVFENLVIGIENNKLTGDATGQGKGELVADTKADTYNVPGYNAVIIFIRDAENKVTKYRMQVQGQEFEGEKIE